MIPAKYLEYLKTAPIDKVDFVATFIEVKETDWMLVLLVC